MLNGQYTAKSEKGDRTGNYDLSATRTERQPSCSLCGGNESHYEYDKRYLYLSYVKEARRDNTARRPSYMQIGLYGKGTLDGTSRQAISMNVGIDANRVVAEGKVVMSSHFCTWCITLATRVADCISKTHARYPKSFCRAERH